MPIIFARVDDRLIHGQIVQAWLPELNVDEILIPCCKDSSLNRGLLRLSLPYEYELTILDTRSCARYAAQSDRRIFLLMGSLKEFTDLIKDGLQIKSINIGGMHFKDGAQKLDDNVFLDANDKQFLKLIRDLGIQIETRAVPSSASVSVSEVLK
ncbi:PTS sugar transporter subunit IIB [Candidatus Avelusimicrobium fimicolum]|jgi:PTS system mannose-specific IIB component|uniref:PTS system mannose/fructose/N-acetylgalactosamine-transporter subunit IIB n=1 Tax=Candidatus Avelusimicrobium TaxID=2840538 RepID=UPI0015AB04DF|nr:PTS mannose/fructose/sorbose transporter subunit IIB [Spirochaetia bacterium]MDY3910687.1 PTS sugar transporter subunit IIB [Elusimicrobiaceae bacterium]